MATSLKRPIVTVRIYGQQIGGCLSIEDLWSKQAGYTVLFTQIIYTVHIIILKPYDNVNTTGP